MPFQMTSVEYEELLSQLAENLYGLAEGRGPDDVRFGSSNHWLGASGHEHQIDVSVTGPDDVMLIECKCWNKEVPVEAVLAFLGRLIDIQPMDARQLHGMIVTTVGFQDGARKVADHYGIHATVVRSASEFALAYNNHRAVGVAETIKVTEHIRIERRCGICGSELVSTDGGGVYRCPRCDE